MDWNFAIERNKQALTLIIAGLIALVDGAETLPRPLHRFVCRVLRPAESALRRLIVIVAAGLRQKAEAADNSAADKRPLPDFAKFGRGQNRAAFALIDPRKSFGESGRAFRMPVPAGALPQISAPGLTERIQWAKSDERLEAKTLSRRIEKLEQALKTLPRQARRLNRLMLRRAKAKPGPGRVGPIRPGHPPGYRRRPRHPVDDVLRDCHGLARNCGLP